MVSQQYIEELNLLKEKMFNDVDFVAFNRKRDTRRLIVREEIENLLNSFLDDNISIEEFRSIFDRKTRTDWDVFGVKGFAGAMFLNKLIKHIPESKILPELKMILKQPESLENAYKNMSDFQEFLEQCIEDGVTTRGLLQPGYMPFLVSAFWHMQNVEKFPIFYKSARQALIDFDVFQPTNHSTEDYFSFFEIYTTIKEELEISTWELEHLFVWQQEQDIEVEEPNEKIEVDRPSENSPSQIEADSSTHTAIQLLLAKIGRELGYHVWIASNDHNRVGNGERLGDYSISELPIFNGVGSKSQKMIELIDVLWLKGSSRIVAAFEIESTTSIYSGLLRMSDLNLALDLLSFPIYISVPEKRLHHVQEQLSRLTFQHLELHQICRYFSFEDLIKEAENIMRWASDHTAMDKISKKVGTVSDVSYY